MPMKPVKEYDVELDRRKRVRLEDPAFSSYHVQEFPDGHILLEPTDLVVPVRFESGKERQKILGHAWAGQAAVPKDGDES